MKKCDKCGHTVDDDSMVFCIKCGAKLSEMMPDVRKCPSCGAVNSDGSVFCCSCGAKLSVQDSIQEKAYVGKGKNKSSHAAAAGILAFLAAAGAICGVVFAFGHGGADKAGSGAGLQTEASVSEIVQANDEPDNDGDRAVMPSDKHENILKPAGSQYGDLLFPAKKDGSWGFCDTSGKFVIEPRFELLSRFSKCGLAAFYENGRYGFIDRSGNVVIEPQFDECGDFQENGYCCVCIAGKWGVIDTKGEYAVSPKFNVIVDSYDDKGATCVGEMGGGYNNEGKYTTLMKYGFIDPRGEYITKPEFTSIIPWDAYDKYYDDGSTPDKVWGEDGLAVVGMPVSVRCWNGDYAYVTKYGYVDKTGKIIIEPRFFYAYHFSDNGAAIAADMEDGDYDNEGVNYYRYGVIDKSGKYSLSPKYAEISRFAQNGLAHFDTSIIEADTNGYIDKNGNEVLTFDYSEQTETFADNGLACAYYADYNGNKWVGYINKNGNAVIKVQYDYIFDFQKNGLAKIAVGNWNDCRYGFIDENGKTVINPQFDEADDFDEKGMARIRSGNKYGYINEKGEYIIKAEYDSISTFGEYGLAVVCRNGKYGLIDRTGEYVVEPQFDKIG